MESSDRVMTGSPEDFAKIERSKPQNRIASPDEVAAAILFLLSDAAVSMTAQVLHVNNGSYRP
jgi:3-oxoacyl-[acyl-carrier protein] reductase